MKKLQPHLIDRIATIMRRLDALKEADRLVALRGVNRLLRDNGLSWESLLQAESATKQTGSRRSDERIALLERIIREKDAEISRLTALVEQPVPPLERRKRRTATDNRITVWMDFDGYMHVKMSSTNQTYRLKHRMDDAGNKAAIKDMLNEMKEFCREHKLSQGQLATMQKRLRQRGFRYRTQKRSALVVL